MAKLKASDYLKKKAEEEAKKVDKKYGKDAYGSTADLKKKRTLSVIKSAVDTVSKNAQKTVAPIVSKTQSKKSTQPKDIISPSNLGSLGAIDLGLGPVSYDKVKSLYNSGSVRVNSKGKLEWSNQFQRDTTKAYTNAKKTATTKTTYKSDLSEKERKKRIREIEDEVKNLKIQLTGYARAKAYGTSEAMEKKEKEVQDKVDELVEEWKTLKRTGTFSASELKQFEIEDAKAKKNALPNYNPTARVAPSSVEAYKKNVSDHYALDEKIDTLERQKGLYDNIDKYSDDVHKDDYEGDIWAWFKNFGSQWSANYRNSALDRAADKAMAEYDKNPTEENREIAYAYDALVKQYAQNNKSALDDKNANAPWLSKTLAGYLPQFQDQIIPELVGGGLGSLIGGKTGASIGSGIASYATMYDVMRGSVLRELLAEGVDEETAREAASDEAFISSLIESGGTAASWALLGTGKAFGAIGTAAKSSVAKGSTNGAVKFIANMATNKAASQAATPLWKTGLKIGAGIIGNAGTEYGEEFLQQGVSIANKERAKQGETGYGNLIKSTAKVTKDAVTGKNPKALSEMHEAGKEGFKIGLMMGSAQTVINNVGSHVANAKTIKNQNEILDTIINDEETLSALIDEGKASGEKSVSAKIAKEIETAKEKGKVTRDHIRRLIAANDVYIKEEERVASNTDTLELAAMDVVESKSKKTPTTVKTIKKATGFGDEGAKLVSNLIDSKGLTLEQAEGAVKTAYTTGFTNVDKTKVRFATPLQEQAFDAGKRDRIMDDTIAKANVKKATVYEGAFTENEYTKNFTDAERKMISTVSKHLGMDVAVVDKIIANKALGIEANAEHQDGKMRISSTAEKVIYKLVMHESGHRMKQLAPTEFGVLMDALYERSVYKSKDSGFPLTADYDLVKTEHENAGIAMNTSGYLEEFAARELETILDSAEAFNSWVAEIDSQPQVKSAWQKFVDWISQVVEDIKSFISQRNMTKEERAEAKRTLAELERIKELYANAYKAARSVVAESETVQKVEAKAETKKDTSTEAKKQPVAKETKATNKETTSKEKTDTAAKTKPSKTVADKTSNNESTAKTKPHNISGKMTEKTKNALDKKSPQKVVGIRNGRAYISDGKIAIPINRSDMEFVKTEWGLTDNQNIARVVEETINNNEFVPISSNPVEGKVDQGYTVYMFTTDDGRQIAVQKKYAKYFDGYNLSATFVKGAPYAIKATDADGNFAGLVMGIKPMGNKAYELTDIKDVSMKSFKDKTYSLADTNSSKNLEIKINEEYNGNVNYSLKWRTDLNRTQYKQVEKWIHQAGNPETTRITDTANWYKGRINGEDLFVIYSDKSTVLYERKGREARAELDILLEQLEEIENGRSIVEVSEDINTLLSGDWLQEKHNLANNNAGLGGRGSNSGYASVLQGKSSKFIGSQAFRNVVKNLFDIQEKADELNRSKSHSLKDTEYLKLAKDPVKNEARLREMVDEAAKNAFPDSKLTTKDGKLRIVYHGTNTGDFTVFNPDYIGMSSGDDGFFGMGFYFAYSKGEASYCKANYTCIS